MCMFHDSEDSIWIVSYYEGLYKIRNTQKQCVKVNYQNTDDKISNQTVSSILEDYNGMIWLGTSTGIYILDKEKECIVKNQ